MEIIDRKEEKARLVVVLPGALAGSLRLAQRAYRIALAAGMDVTYLALLGRGEDDLAVTRSLTTMKALTGDGGLSASAACFTEASLAEALRQTVRPGDEVLCLDGHVLERGFLRRISIQDALHEVGVTPVRAISGFFRPRPSIMRRGVLELVFWLGSLAILAGFAYLEVRIDHDVQGSVRAVILAFTLLIEIGVFFAWTSLLRR